ncbi:MAG: ABC transporter ATP-binding protein [Acidobacteria bacterium]|nr:ABC transporter ATP-binding protein [Acidobacteriota bacterium]
MIEARNVMKTYGSGDNVVHALRGVSLSINAGEVTALMGPSGSGKTTLISILGGILSATSGSVRIDGREIVGLAEGELPALRRDLFGFIFQGFNLFPALTAAENVSVMCQLKHVPEPKKRALELLRMVGLEDKARTHPSDLSGGQKQRVAIARALAGEPRILLADEPTAALDSVSGRTVLEILSGLAREKGRAVIIVTHDPRVLEYCDRIVHIADGRVESDSYRTVEEVA